MKNEGAGDETTTAVTTDMLGDPIILTPEADILHDTAPGGVDHLTQHRGRTR